MASRASSEPEPTKADAPKGNGTIKRQVGKPRGGIRQRKGKKPMGGCKGGCKGLQSSWGLGGKSGHFRHSLHAHLRQWACLGVCPCPSAVVARSARSKNGRRGRGNRQGSLASMGISLVAQKPRFLPPSAPKLASPCIPLCITPHFGFCPPSAFYAPSGLARQPFYMVLSLWRICLCSALAFTLAHLAPFCPLCPFGGLPKSLAF